MFQKAMFLTLAILGFFACNLFAAQINSNWVGGAGDFWETVANWNPTIVPDNTVDTFDVTIDSGLDFSLVICSENHIVDTLTCYGNIELAAETQGVIFLTLAGTGGLVNNGEFLIDGEFEISGNVTNRNGAFFEMGSISLWNRLTNEAGGEVKIVGIAEIGEIYNDGKVVIDTMGIFCADEDEFRNNGHIEIYDGQCRADDALDNTSTGIIKGFGVILAEEGIINAGQIIAEGGSLAISIEDDNSGVVNTGLLQGSPLSSLQIRPGMGFVMNNAGTIIAHAGGGVAFDCDVANEPNGVIHIAGGTLAAHSITQKAGAEMEGFGNITGDMNIDTNGLAELTGPTNIIGDVQIDPGATLEISDGTTLVTGHTTNNGTIHMKGGRIIPQGGITNNGQILWEPGIYNNIADFNLDGKVDLMDFAVFSDTWLWQTQW